MAGTAQFTIGTEANCSDGAVGRISRVIVGVPATVGDIGRVQEIVIDRGSQHQRRRNGERLVR